MIFTQMAVAWVIRALGTVLSILIAEPVTALVEGCARAADRVEGWR